MPTVFLSPSNSTFPRRYKEEVEIVFSAIDCLLNRELAIYCSSEITSGLRLFQALRRQNVKTASELVGQMGEAWFDANIKGVNVNAANEFARFVRDGLSDNTMVITPAPFDAAGWDQDQYLFFWETLIRTRIKSVWFNRDWQFSNGCTFEFAVAQDAGHPTFDHRGEVLDRVAGLGAIGSAIERLEADGFDTAKLRKNFERVRAARMDPAEDFRSRR